MSIYLKHNNIEFQVGDTIKVYQKIVDGEKTRTQVFEGLVIKIKGHQNEKTFTVRKVTGGFGVERIWPVDSPFIEKIRIVNKGKVKRAKLYYLRNRIGRSALKVETDYEANIKEQKIKKDIEDAKKLARKQAQEERVAAKKAEAKKVDPKPESEPKQKSKPEEEKAGEQGGTADKEEAAK